MIHSTSKSCTTTKINVTARSVTYVANELYRVGLEITNARGVPNGALVNGVTTIMRGLRVWLGAHQLKAIVIEFYNSSGKCTEVYELPIQYGGSDSPDEKYVTQIDELKAAVMKLPPSKAKKYRFLVVTEDNSFPVPGWDSCERSDVSKLKKRSLLERLISTSAVDVSAFVFIGDNVHEA